jgi:hypothetical protein
MKIEDYDKYYINGSDHYLMPKGELIELFDEMVNWREESKQLKEVIDKAIEYIKEKQKIQYKFALSHIECDDLLQILDILKEK